MWAFMHRGVRVVLVLSVLLAFLTGCSMKTETTAERTPGPDKQETSGGDREPVSSKPVPAGEGNKISGVILNTVVDVFLNPDTQSERVTQAIYNQPVEILGRREGWINVRVVDGYTGWIKEKYLEENTGSIRSAHFKYRLVVTSKTNKIYAKPGSISLKDIVMGTELYVLNKDKGYYEVALPGNTTGWINESGIMQLGLSDSIPKTAAIDFITTASKFKGTIYLWGGVSARGLDCSGFTYICSRVNGIDLPRSADKQYESMVGTKIEGGIEAIKLGDLLFFSSNTDLKGIAQVGIYTGDSQFLQASKSKGAVSTASLKESYFQNRLVGIRRIFNE
jgi:gamma-D-glutamyl-L-lysine dipeptidyl-peptidase